MEDRRIELLDARENWIVCDHGCGLRVDRRRCLQSVRSPKAMLRSQFRRQVGHVQVRRNPS